MCLMMVQVGWSSHSFRVQDSGKNSFALAASSDIGKCKDTTVIILSATMLSWTDLEVRTGFWNVSLLKKPENSQWRSVSNCKMVTCEHTALLPILRSKRRLTHFRRFDGLGVSDSSWLSLLIRNSLNMRFLDVPICNTAVLGEGTGGKANTRGELEGGG
ncbi:hypothetical protein BD769DRAFT_1471564 [Suillus cothurnatus]|nr:hypothetical protein BD769DRAFT_1471564 [Suillus cothurnatus]